MNARIRQPEYIAEQDTRLKKISTELDRRSAVHAAAQNELRSTQAAERGWKKIFSLRTSAPRCSSKAAGMSIRDISGTLISYFDLMPEPESLKGYGNRKGVLLVAGIGAGVSHDLEALQCAVKRRQRIQDESRRAEGLHPRALCGIIIACLVRPPARSNLWRSIKTS